MTQRFSFAELSGWLEGFERDRLREGGSKAVLEPAHPLLREPAPCDKCCFWTRCKSQLLACDRFSLFVAGRPWASAPTEPSRKHWETLFDEPRAQEERKASGLRAI
jgi:hypothetical protein